MNITISAGWTTLLAFAAGAFTVGLLWWRDRQKGPASLVELRLAVHNLVCDGRRNSLLEGIVRKAAGGNLHARKDFELLDAVVMAAFRVYGAGLGPHTVWGGLQSRAQNYRSEPDRAEEDV